MRTRGACTARSRQRIDRCRDECFSVPAGRSDSAPAGARSTRSSTPTPCTTTTTDAKQLSYLLLFGIPSTTHSFFTGPSLSANPSHCSPSFLLLKYSLHGFPGLFTAISEHICFLLLVFSVFALFSCRCRAVDKADSCWLSSAR